MGIAKYARKLLERLDARVLEAGANLDKDDREQMHQLRIECKKLRYAAEFSSPVIPGLDAFIAHLKGLQDVLGTLNDVSVMCGLLADLLTGQSDPDVTRYSCALVGWRTREGCKLLKSFEQRGKAFAQSNIPWGKRRTDVSSGWS